METIRQTLKVPKNHEVKIKIPDYVNENDSVEAIVIIGLEDNKKKIDELKKAMNDKLFLEDLNEIEKDFENVDLEDWD
ncbi:MAG TPA: hypothetical protein PLO36_06160 [Methanofastidiosum sp.]|nr:hypothetical protein [Methanofastidiosum sp.]HPA49698.1 hypothetical protein [Methanofastidiosum sp.]HQK62601.1 hypothetical protein [Methanofastidiosum sp.]HQQ49388.1 hypothetical protein [Methanofastidiosum sp.]